MTATTTQGFADALLGDISPKPPAAPGRSKLRTGSWLPDEARVRLGLARMDWVKAFPPQRRRPLVNGLAAELLLPIAQARLGVPPTTRSISPIPSQCRQRKPGGGRRPNTAGEILASDIEIAFEKVGLHTGVWHVGRGTSPLLQVYALCWQMATGVAVKDPRRMFKKMNGQSTNVRRWNPMTTDWDGFPVPRPGLAPSALIT